MLSVQLRYFFNLLDLDLPLVIWIVLHFQETHLLDIIVALMVFSQAFLFFPGLFQFLLELLQPLVIVIAFDHHEAPGIPRLCAVDCILIFCGLRPC